MPDTDLLASLPDPNGFRRVTKALAMLDAIVEPEWEYRYHSFNARWDTAKNEMLASMRDGSGDSWFAVLSGAGVALHGLAHESPTFESGRPKPWVFRELPKVFHPNLLHEAAADTANSTFCIWRLPDDTVWRTGARRPDEDAGDDGAEELIRILDGDPRRYVELAREVYEFDVSPGDVRSVYDHAPLTPELVSALNPDADPAKVRADALEIGYPDRG